MRPSRPALVAVLLTAAAARAGMVCDTLATASRYAALGSKSIGTTLVFDVADHCHHNPTFHAGICTTSAKLAATPILDGGAGYATGLTALLADLKKRAVYIGPRPTGTTCALPFIAGDLATGGGQVVSAPGFSPGQTGVVDTTGAHPALAACTQALADVAAASAAFAAMPPTQVFDKVSIKVGLELDVAVADGDVVSFKSLKLARGPYDHSTNGGCTGPQARLVFTGLGPGEKAVVNAPKLDIGDCAVITSSEPGGLVFNAPGSGGVHVGISVDLAGSAILAPERNVALRGPGTPTPSSTGNLWGKTVEMNGNIDVLPIACP